MTQQENMRKEKCQWTIVAPKGSKINITFTSLKMLQKRYTSYLSSTMQSMAANIKRNNTQLTVSTILYV